MPIGTTGLLRRLFGVMRPALLVALLALGACHPVDTWRDMTGASKDDPDPETTPNTKNLVAGEATPSPNLATVPEPPTQALTTAQRDKLTQSLIADRTNAKYTDDKLRAGFSVATATPPPPPPPPPAADTGKAAPGATASPAQGGTGEPATPTAPPVAPVSKEPLGPTAQPGTGAEVASAKGKPAAPPAAMAAEPSGAATKVASAEGKPAAMKPTSGKEKAEPVEGSPKAAAKTASAEGEAEPSARGLRKAGEPPDLGPMESGLQSPQIGSLPQPEMPQPAPPPPALLKKPAGSAARLPGAPAPAPMPAGLGATAYQPPPPPPSLPPTPAAPEPHTAALSGAKPPRPVPVDTVVGRIGFAGNSATLTDADKPVLEQIVARYRKEPAKIRIVGYAGGGAANLDADQLASFHAALGRAQAVAAALTKAGIPGNRITVEAAPAGTDSGQSRAEVLLEH